MMLPRRLWRRGQSRRLGSHRAGGHYCCAAATSLAVPSSRLSETQPPTSKSELQDADRGADLWPARGGHAGSRSESRSAYTDSGQAEGHSPLETGASTRTKPLARQGRKQMHRQVPKRVLSTGTKPVASTSTGSDLSCTLKVLFTTLPALTPVQCSLPRQSQTAPHSSHTLPKPPTRWSHAAPSLSPSLPRSYLLPPSFSLPVS